MINLSLRVVRYLYNKLPWRKPRTESQPTYTTNEEQVQIGQQPVQKVPEKAIEQQDDAISKLQSSNSNDLEKSENVHESKVLSEYVQYSQAISEPEKLPVVAQLPSDSVQIEKTESMGILRSNDWLAEKDLEAMHQIYSESQLETFQRFKAELGESLRSYPDKRFSDFYLMRFLAAREFDIAEGIKMFNEFLRWRRENHVDQIADWRYPELEQVRKLLQNGFHFCDKEGRPVFIQRVEGVSIKQLYEVTNEQDIAKYFIQLFENLVENILPKCTLIRGEKVHKIVYIFDMANNKMQMPDMKKLVKISVDVIKNNYPQILAKLYFVNTNIGFQLIWKGLQYFLAENTRNKTEIISTKDTYAMLTKIIDEDKIPVQLGGKCQCGRCLQQEVGPWQQI